ncbi:tetratricopeptide repeat protein [Myxococcota bacterium]|nr:tetratricopeptide repeat protein [Myxococcota bacterium]
MSEERRRDALVAGAIFLLALALRLLHFREVALNDPYYGLPTVDDVQYDAWARRLAAGDGLVDGVLYLGPGYPVFMALVYGLFGPSLAAVKAVQIGLGAGTSVLVFGLTRELFDRRAAAVAGTLCACYAMLVFYGGTLMTVNLKVPLVVGGGWALVRALRRPGAARFAGAGALFGMAVLVQQTALPWVLLMTPWILFGIRDAAPIGRRVVFAASFLAATFAFILPITLHNMTSGGDFVLLNSMGGPNFYMGNQPAADGTWQVPDLGFRQRADNPDEMQRQFTATAERAAGRTLRPSEISAYWMDRGLAEIRKDPLRWVGLELRKLALHFNAYEVWNIRSFEISRETSFVLRLPLPTLGLVAPLGLLGLLLSLARWRELVVLYGGLLAYLASSLIFFVLARYRMPGMVLLMPFVGFAVVRIADAVRARELRWLASTAAALALLAAFVHLPLESSAGRMHMAWYNLGNQYRELERWDEAIAAYQKSLSLVPGAISTRNNLALAYELAGRREEAIRAWRDVLARARQTRDALRIERALRHLQTLEAEPTAPP